MMKRYTINGYFLTQRTTGIQRYATELLYELDPLCDQGDWELAIPPGLAVPPKLRNIRVVRVGRFDGFRWEQWSLPCYLRKNRRMGIHLCNVIPLLGNGGVAAIHDISYRVNPSFILSYRDRLSALWHRVQYRAIAQQCKQLITVSAFSKAEIVRVYHVDPKRIAVVPNAWQHVRRFDEADDLIQKHPNIVPGEYYFSLSTLAVNKNLPWILRAAKCNPQAHFVVAGGGDMKSFAKDHGFSSLSNVDYLGYISDTEAKALLSHCKAFVFPTFYEGFGIPPLEAVACGTRRLLLSDIPCMHEIFGEYAQYIDPHDPCPSLSDAGNKLTEAEAQTLLDRYSWAKSAKTLFERLMGGESQ